MQKILGMMQTMHKVAAVLKKHVCSIEGVRDIGSDEKFPDARKCAVLKTTQATGFNAEQSYDWNWLCDRVLEKIVQAQSSGNSTIELDNRCCTADNCPQVQLMKFFIEELKK